MKAVACTEYGPPEVFQLTEVQKPTPKDNEVLIKVHATLVDWSQTVARDFTFAPREFWLPILLYPVARMQLGIRKPRHTILGSETAGDVTAVGKDVTQFKTGDQVFGHSERFGANAEYVCMPEDGVLAIKPTNMSYEQAAAVPHGAITALHFLKKAKIKPGERVLIVGASGGIGQFAVQLAKHFGAHVTGVCSTARLGFVESLGVDRVIDYTQEDFAESGQTYDVILDTSGKTLYSRCKGLLTPNGRYLLTAFGMKEVGQMLWTSIRGGKKVICALAPIEQQDLVTLKELIEAGVITTVVDRRYPLEQTAEAHRYVETGQKKASVVVTVNSPHTEDTLKPGVSSHCQESEQEHG